MPLAALARVRLALAAMAALVLARLVVAFQAVQLPQLAKEQPVKAHLFLLRLWRASGVMMILLLLQRAILLELVYLQAARRSR
jgi:hypothetical protein